MSAKKGVYQETVNRLDLSELGFQRGFKQALRFTVAGNHGEMQVIEAGAGAAEANFALQAGALVEALRRQSWADTALKAPQEIRKVLDRVEQNANDRETDDIGEHANRIATAATWAFDAHSDEPNANRVYVLPSPSRRCSEENPQMRWLPH